MAGSVLELQGRIVVVVDVKIVVVVVGIGNTDGTCGGRRPFRLQHVLLQRDLSIPVKGFLGGHHFGSGLVVVAAPGSEAQGRRDPRHTGPFGSHRDAIQDGIVVVAVGVDARRVVAAIVNVLGGGRNILAVLVVFHGGKGGRRCACSGSRCRITIRG